MCGNRPNLDDKVNKLLIQKSREFLRAKRGNVAMMFAICLVPLTVVAGVGLDYMREAMVKTAMNEALDAAALAVGSSSGLNSTTASTLAQQYFNANYKGNSSEGTPVCCTVTYDAGGSVTVSATDQMPATLLKIAGYTTLPVTASSTVVWGQSKLWVALVLDNSGSMAQSDSSGSKMTALKNASAQLLSILQNASNTAGDVQVAIAPFVNVINIGTGYMNSSWIDWTDWEAPPANVTISSTVGPGSNCPFTSSSDGFGCTSGSANGSSSVSKIPTSGVICPDIDSGVVNTAHRDRYYNGCWSSTATTTVTTGNVTTQVFCSNNGNCTVANKCGAYPQSQTQVSGTSTTVTTKTCSCTNAGSRSSCSVVATPVTTTVGAPYTHTWTANSHSTWNGCIMDRDKTYNYDIQNTTPTSTATGFPATNPALCPAATVTTLNYNWSSLSSQIQAMQPGGSTNQAIGVAHGWQLLTPGNPYSAPTVPPNTSRYIILLSDGLNTQDRWWGNGYTEMSIEDGYIDSREKETCDNAKADGIIIYSIYLNIGGDADSAPLAYCASDSSKYFALTSTTAVVSTFNQIAQQITAVRISR